MIQTPLLKHLNTTSLIAFIGGGGIENNLSAPQRLQLLPPTDKGLFIKPLKRSFMQDNRLMPNTKIMIALLSGLCGQGLSITTTMNTLGAQMNRTRRMIWNYVQEAVRFGYISYSRTKNRMGYYTGIKIFMNHHLSRHEYSTWKHKNQAEKRRNHDVKYNAQINPKYIYTKDSDDKVMAALARFASKAGYLDKHRPLVNE